MKERLDQILQSYTADPSDTDQLVDRVMTIVNEERRAAAEAMRERCMQIAADFDVPYAPRTPEERVAHSIKLKIKRLPLDDGRG